MTQWAPKRPASTRWPRDRGDPQRHETSRARHRSRRREGHSPLSPHQGARQAGRSVRGQVPHRRLRPQQLHQLGPLLDLRPHPVQEPVAAPAPLRRLAVRRGPEGSLHHPRTRADAVRRRDVVSGDGGRHLPEREPDRAVRPPPGGDLRGRSHLPDEHRQHDRVPRAEAGGDHRGGHPRRSEARRRVRRHRDGPERAHRGLPRKAPGRAHHPGEHRAGLRLDGQLRLLHAHAPARAVRRCRPRGQHPRLRARHPARAREPGRHVRLRLPGQPDSGGGAGGGRRTGATWGRSTPTTRPRWTCAR